MNKYIVTTTINPPQAATLSFLNKSDWKMIIVGDSKTPHDLYKKLMETYKNLIYLDCADQDKLYPDLSAVLGWKSIRRRNIGYVLACNSGADVIATVDDDNIPYATWGQNSINAYAYVDLWDCETPIFDPLSVTNHNYLWHRGFPLSLTKKKNNVTYVGKHRTTVAVQADLWDGDPDVDAIQRMTIQPCVKFNITQPYMGSCTTVFDSQNTFLARECFPAYSVLPFVGRMDDIFGGYLMQVLRPDLHVVFSPASVYQARNKQNLITNLKEELIGYEYALEFVNRLKFNRDIKDVASIVPKETLEFYEIYQKAFNI